MTGRMGRALVCAAMGLGVLASIVPATADQPTEWKCNAKTEIPPDERIAACTAVLDSGEYGRISLISAHFHRASAYVAKHEFEHAVADYSALIDLYPENMFVYGFRAYAYFQLGEFDRAIADYARTIELNPRSRYAYFSRGVAYYRKGDYDHAIADYTEAMRLGHQDQQISSGGKAQTRHQKDDPLPPPVDGQSNGPMLADGHARYARGSAYYAKGDMDRAIVDYDEAIRLNPKDKDALIYRSNAYKQKGDLDRATADCDRIVQLDPQDARAYRARAMVNWQGGLLSKSLTDFDEALRLDPKNAYVALWREIVAKRNDQPGQLAEAVTHLDMTKWPAPIINMFLGVLTPEQVLGAADDSDPKTRKGQVCEANFYAAEFALQRHSKEDALRLFELAQADCPKTFIEVQASNVELKALQATP